MHENRDLTNTMAHTDPSLEEIVRHECGCRCGKDDCEFAADFFTPQGRPTRAFGDDEDLLDSEFAADNGAFSIAATDYGYGRAGAEERADERNSAYTPNPWSKPCPDAEFAEEYDDKVHLSGDMSVNYGGVTDDTPYHDTATYKMIDPNEDAFNTSGS